MHPATQLHFPSWLVKPAGSKAKYFPLLPPFPDSYGFSRQLGLMGNFKLQTKTRFSPLLVPFYKVNLNNLSSSENVYCFFFLGPTLLNHVSFLYCSSASWNPLKLPWCFLSTMSVLSGADRDLLWVQTWAILSLARALWGHPVTALPEKAWLRSREVPAPEVLNLLLYLSLQIPLAFIKS